MLLTEIHQKQMMNLLIRAARAVSSTSLLKIEKQKRGVLEEKWAKTSIAVLKKWRYTFESKYSRIRAVSLREPDNAAGGLQPISSAGICFFVQAGKG